MNRNKERKDGILDFVLFAIPLVGILFILFSKKESKNIKIASLIGTVIGLIIALIYYFVYLRV